MAFLTQKKSLIFGAFMILVFSLVQVHAKPFPKNFTWGVATASYQIEGAAFIDGKGLNIWDNFTKYPGVIRNNDTGEVADDFYHKYPEDIKLMKQLGIKNFRMSLSWARIFPDGTKDNINQKGVDFYNNVINALLAAGIEPWVTLFHWDLPNAFNDRTANSTWLNPDIVNKFNDYADFCFKTFGDRVKYWITFNEIHTFAWIGYGQGTFAPGRCSPSYQQWCQEIGGGGDSGTEPYIVAHHALLSHAQAVNTYRTKYQKTQKGLIGLTIDSFFGEPYDANNPDDVAAVETYVQFFYGWFGDPVVFGKYPDVMVNYTNGRDRKSVV